MHEHANAPTHLPGTDQPGRVHQSFGNARSAIEQTDWHDEAQRVFLESLAHRLDTAGETSDLHHHRRAARARHAPAAPAIRQALRGEIDKDYGKVPIREIEKHLAASVSYSNGMLCSANAGSMTSSQRRASP